MGFIKTLINSIYSPAFYREVPKKTLGNALVYFIILNLIASLISTLLIVPLLLPLKNEIPKFVNSIVNYYPKNLVIEIKNGEVSTNVKEPYFIPLPDGSSNYNNERIDNLLVIDTKTPFTSKQFEKYHAAAWLAKDSVFYRSDNGNSIRTYSLNEVDDLTINKPFVKQIADKVSPVINFIIPFLIVFLVFVLYIFYLFRFIYLFFLAFIIWIIAKISNWNFTYGQSYIISIYISTAAFLLGLLIGAVKVMTGFSGFPLMGTVITIVLLFLNFSNYPKSRKSIKKS